MDLPVEVNIGATILKGYAKGDSIEERFRACITPQALRDGCWMTTNEDMQFRSAVGGVFLSYPEDAPERTRISAEMRQLAQFSALIHGARAGLNVSLASITPDPENQPIGLMGIWHQRSRD